MGNNYRGLKIKYFVSPLGVLIIIFMIAASALSHGPKGHSEEAFTAFQAAKKGVTLYDKLLASGKLTESWETDLVNIEVSTRGARSKKEFVVKFIRSTSGPRAVFIFFSGNGEYIGSNFIGK
jgi:hypothetical protein